MPTFDPIALARETSGSWTRLPTQPLKGFGMDTRKLGAGQVFVAIQTAQRDGHDFIGAAAAAGAVGALVAREDAACDLPQLVVADPLKAWHAIARAHRRSFGKPVVGISGSAGKTSTKNLLALLLGDRVLATEGNLNNHLGVPLTLTRLDSAQHDFAVIEAGISAPDEMAPLAGMIEPDVAIVTMVGNAHTEELGGLEGVAREKAVLAETIRGTGIAVFPENCRIYGPFRDLDVRTMTVERADVLRPSTPRKDCTYFTVTHRDGETALAIAYGLPPPMVFTMRRVSDGMAQNAVLAICAALWLGVGRETIQRRLLDWRAPKLRGEIREDRDRLYYLDCYNANPESMSDALRAFVNLVPDERPRLYLLGNMEELGPTAPDHHRTLGAGLRLRPQDHVCVIGTDAAAVRAGAIESGASPEQIEVLSDLGPAASRLRDWRGAVFLKGSRRYQLETILQEAAVLAEAPL